MSDPTEEAPLHTRITVMQLLPALHSGGVERGTLEIAQALIEQGHRAVVVSNGGPMVAQLTQIGAEHITLPVGEKRLSTLAVIPKLRRLLKQYKIDVLHLRSRLPAWTGYLAWKSLPQAERPGLVTTVHGPYSVNRYSAIMTQGQRVIAVSNMIRDYIAENYPKVDMRRVEVIHRGVDPVAFPYGYKPDSDWRAQFFAEFPQTKGKRLLTLPGRLTRWKGGTTFIDLIEQLVCDYPDIHGVMVGGSDPRRAAFETELRERIAKRGLQEHITLTGTRTDLKEIMAISTLVFSLANEPEAFGRTTLESLSLGVPVVGFDHGGVGEQLDAIFPQGKVPVNNTIQLRSITAALLDHPEAPKQHHPFTLQYMTRRTLAVYQQVINGLREK